MTCTCPVCGTENVNIDLVILPERGMVVSGGKFVLLTGKEARLLAILSDAYPRMVSKSQILYRLYDTSADEPMIKIVDVFICKLRKKLEPLGVEITTGWGNGYALEGNMARVVMPLEDDLQVAS